MNTMIAIAKAKGTNNWNSFLFFSDVVGFGIGGRGIVDRKRAFYTAIKPHLILRHQIKLIISKPSCQDNSGLKRGM
jgi:hypothetical protein